MKILMISILLMLTGCAGKPPQWLANYYNSSDPCQLRNNGGNYPQWCGATSGRATIYTNNGAPVGYIQNSR